MVCVSTPHGSHYIQWLCKHWTHKFQVECSEWRGRIFLPAGACTTLVAEAETLNVGLEASDIEVLERMQGVVETRLRRFACKEELPIFAWRLLGETSLNAALSNQASRDP
jgi:hypothetical protein